MSEIIYDDTEWSRIKKEWLKSIEQVQIAIGHAQKVMENINPKKDFGIITNPRTMETVWLGTLRNLQANAELCSVVSDLVLGFIKLMDCFESGQIERLYNEENR